MTIQVKCHKFFRIREYESMEIVLLTHFFYCLSAFLFRIHRPMIMMTGKTHPNRIPMRKLSPDICVNQPTALGPKAPPRSPAIANSANIAVPPRGNCFEEMLSVPGHMMPTEKPQMTQPTSPVIGLRVMEARR